MSAVSPISLSCQFISLNLYTVRALFVSSYIPVHKIYYSYFLRPPTWNLYKSRPFWKPALLLVDWNCWLLLWFLMECIAMHRQPGPCEITKVREAFSAVFSVSYGIWEPRCRERTLNWNFVLIGEEVLHYHQTTGAVERRGARLVPGGAPSVRARLGQNWR